MEVSPSITNLSEIDSTNKMLSGAKKNMANHKVPGVAKVQNTLRLLFQSSKMQAPRCCCFEEG